MTNVTQRDIDQILKTGRLYVPDEVPDTFDAFLFNYFKANMPTIEEYKRAFGPPPDLSKMAGDFNEEQKKFLRDHGFEIW